jgi:hypothetical protein
MAEKECDLGCLLNAQAVHVVVTIPFATDEQRTKVQAVEQALGEAGIHFDRGTCGTVRDWYWDWSLKGCRVVMSKKQPGRKRRLKLPLFKTQGLG